MWRYIDDEVSWAICFTAAKVAVSLLKSLLYHELLSTKRLPNSTFCGGAAVSVCVIDVFRKPCIWLVYRALGVSISIVVLT